MLGTQSTNGFRLLATILLVVGFFSVLKPSEFIFGSRGPTNMDSFARIQVQTLPTHSKDIPKLIMVVGYRSKPLLTDKGEAVFQKEIQQWTLERSHQDDKLGLFFFSLCSYSGADVQAEVHILGTTEAVDKVQDVVASLNMMNLNIVHTHLNSTMLKSLTDPLVAMGLPTTYFYRLWDFGKIWVEKLIPKTVDFGIVLDIDVCFQKNIQHLFTEFKALRAADSGWVMGGVHEPVGDYEEGAHTPWTLANNTNVNSGVMLTNFDRMRQQRWLDHVLPTALKQWMVHPYWIKSDQSSWPPEQWLFNVVWGSHPRYFQPLNDMWNTNCNDASGPWVDTPNELDFQRHKTQAWIIHYCNNKITDLVQSSMQLLYKQHKSKL
eukprot:m.86024 g.86024  ORF g.86024 m.86024 type:complete len:377 (-) comp25918_c0_seq4:569-1699(-)